MKQKKRRSHPAGHIARQDYSKTQNSSPSSFVVETRAPSEGAALDRRTKVWFGFGLAAPELE